MTKAPFTQEQVKELNAHQTGGLFHPYTCPNDGDRNHIDYEFNRRYPGQEYEAYLEEQMTNGVRYPEMEFNQTNLVATEAGWICPVCGYRQDWTHG